MTLSAALSLCGSFRPLRLAFALCFMSSLASEDSMAELLLATPVMKLHIRGCPRKQVVDLECSTFGTPPLGHLALSRSCEGLLSLVPFANNLAPTKHCAVLCSTLVYCGMCTCGTN